MGRQDDGAWSFDIPDRGWGRLAGKALRLQARVVDRQGRVVTAPVERLVPIAAKGGYLVSCDHQTPPGVSYQDYRLYLRLFREYAEEAGRLSRERARQTENGLN